MSSNTTACTIPAIGVRPPLLMLVIVRAMAPVAGIPPNIGEARLATPCATSSVFELRLRANVDVALFMWASCWLNIMASLSIPVRL